MASSAEKPSSKGQAWFCATGLPSDIAIEVEDMTYHLHKFPLMSKSRKLHQLITEQETNPNATTTTTTTTTQNQQQSGDNEVDEIEEVQCQLSLPDFPGGSENFEMAAKFCYGVKIELTASTAAPLRCAGEFLEMTEEYSEDNLVSKTERFFTHNVFGSVRDSVRALKSCERVAPLAEALGIVQRCIDSIVSRAASSDPSYLFGWPVNEVPNQNRESAKPVSKHAAFWNGIRNNAASAADTWLDDVASLSLPLFKRLISAMKSRDSSNPEIIESCLILYAKKHLPGTSRLSRKPPPGRPSTAPTASESEQRELLETIISNLPLEKGTGSSTSTRFLFGLLRTANILKASEQCRFALEKKIGSRLEQAALDDLLIPSYSYLNETLYDVDCVERILGLFLDGLEEAEDNARSPALMLVGKLIDGYLAEIASDANLKPDRFYNLAISLPEQARLFDDGLYRAVDIYLKAHPLISEAEREKICGVIDCQKLTLEACTHAAQNERLPLRAVVQVLFFEQLQLRHAIAGTLIAAEAAPLAPLEPGRPSVIRLEQEGEVGEEEGAAEGGVSAAAQPATWRAAVRENQVLRLDMDSMRTRVHQLERECSSMKKVIEKIGKEEGPSKIGRWKGSLTRKFGCNLKTQVCDSHEQAVVNGRKRGPQHPHQE